MKFLLTGFVFLMTSLGALAQELNDRSTTWGGSPDDYEGPWSEVVAGQLPPAPHDDNLRRVISAKLDDRYRYQLDRDSVAVFRDNTFRYTVVIESANGVRNVFYEALRCETREYKTFAYLSGAAFRATSNADWQAIRKSGLTIYRKVLLDEYVCAQSSNPAPREEILAKLDDLDRRSARQIFSAPRETETGRDGE